MRVQATNTPHGFEVTTDGVGVVGHAGAALLRELADRLGLTAADPTASGAVLAAEVERRFGVRLHRRTVERARRR